MKSKANKPIIVFGTGRSGTTIFHQMLSRHPQLSWISPFMNKWPDKPIVNRSIMKALDAVPIEKILRRFHGPKECYPYWEFLCKGFSNPCRDLYEFDVTERNRKRIIKELSRLTTNNREILLIKITGWPRTGFLLELFENAKFIHVIRDGRSVANSLISVAFWQGWTGPQNWRWGPLPEKYNDEWQKYRNSFPVLAAIQWKILMDAAEKAKKNIPPSQLLELKYEDLCNNPIEIFRSVVDFCELEWNDAFHKNLNSYSLVNTNNKYKKDLSPHQQKELNEVLHSHLDIYGYI